MAQGWLQRLFATPEAPVSDWEWLTAQDDPWAELQRMFQHPDMLHCQYLAFDQRDGLIHSAPRQHVLVLGRQRSNKTTGVLVPNILCAPGPVVSVSTKDDVYRATAVCRARLGRLWHFNLSNQEPLPGCIPLRWSPVTAAGDITQAGIVGMAMAEAAETSGDNAAYFRLRSGDLLVSLLHAAALTGKDMRWVVEATSQRPDVLRDAADALVSSASEYTAMAADSLRELMNEDGRSKDPVFATARNAVMAYRYPEGLEPSRNVNFDPAAFVAGDQDAPALGRYTDRDHRISAQLEQRQAMLRYKSGLPHGSSDTIYITAGTRIQRLVANIIVGLLTAIQEACYNQHRLDTARNRPVPRPPTLFALDEMANLAPMRDLPSTLSQGSGQNLLVMGVLQDFALAQERWGHATKAFLTLFGEVVMFPGQGNEETLKTISALSGQSWITRTQRAEQTGTTEQPGLFKHYSSTESTTITESEQLLPNLDISELRRMQTRDAIDRHPNRVLVMQSTGGIGFAECTPYYSAEPFLRTLVTSTAWAGQYFSAFEERSQLRPPLFECNIGKYEDLHRWGVRQMRLMAEYHNTLSPWAARTSILGGAEFDHTILTSSRPLCRKLVCPAPVDVGWLRDQLRELGPTSNGTSLRVQVEKVVVTIDVEGNVITLRYQTTLGDAILDELVRRYRALGQDVSIQSAEMVAAWLDIPR